MKPLTRAQVTSRVRKLGPGWTLRKADTRGWLATQEWARTPYTIQWRGAGGPYDGAYSYKTFKGRSWDEVWAKVEAGTPDRAFELETGDCR